MSAHRRVGADVNQLEWLSVAVHIVWVIIRRAREVIAKTNALGAKAHGIDLFAIAYEQQRSIVIGFAFPEEA